MKNKLMIILVKNVGGAQYGQHVNKQYTLHVDVILLYCHTPFLCYLPFYAAMSTSRRSSKSTRSTVTTRSNRPPTWRATSLISGTAPGPPLIVSKNSSAPEVSIVTAEPETVSSSVSESAASQLAPTISKRTRMVKSNSTDGRLRAERKNSTRTRLKDVFPSEDLGKGEINAGDKTLYVFYIL